MKERINHARITDNFNLSPTSFTLSLSIKNKFFWKKKKKNLFPLLIFSNFSLPTFFVLCFQSEPVNSVNELEDEEVDEQQPQQSGEYYLALPDGRLQRVRYVSRQNVEAMKYFAKIRAENVEPLRGPIYAYAPLQKLQIFPAGLQLAVSPVAPQSKPQKLEIEPVAAQVQYQYDNPSAVLPLSGYQAAAGESRYLLTLQ